MVKPIPTAPLSDQRAVQTPQNVLDPEYYRFLKFLRDAVAERLTMVSKAGAPVAADIPAGEFRVFKNTSTSAVVLAVNDAGTVKTVALT